MVGVSKDIMGEEGLSGVPKSLSGVVGEETRQSNGSSSGGRQHHKYHVAR